MELYYTRTKISKNISFEGKVEDLLHLESLNPETVVIIRNNTILTGDTILKNSDKISFLPVISGG